MKPIITVGICVRNGEPFIRNAIESVVKQDFPHELMEIIFVDDGSQDKTLSIIKEYVKNIDVRFKIFSTEWMGIGHARKIVVDNAEGKYIVWVDSDTILPSNFISKQVDFMEKNKNVGIAAGMIWIRCGENAILTLELAPYIVKYYHTKRWRTEDATKLPGTAGTICRTNLIRKVGGFDETINVAGEDQELAKRMKDAGWLICRTNAIFYETRGNMSTWKQLWQKYLWYGLSSFELYRRRIYKLSILTMNPIAGFIAGLLAAMKAYPIIRRKILFLCPAHFAIKMFAWLYGFSKAKTLRK